jgi:hypothetical protein
MNRDLSHTAIWDFCRRHDLAVSESAEMLGAHKSQISRWEPGWRKVPPRLKGFLLRLGGTCASKESTSLRADLNGTSHRPANRGIAQGHESGRVLIALLEWGDPGKKPPLESLALFSRITLALPKASLSCESASVAPPLLGYRDRNRFTCKNIERLRGTLSPSPPGVYRIEGLKRGRNKERQSLHKPCPSIVLPPRCSGRSPALPYPPGG